MNGLSESLSGLGGQLAKLQRPDFNHTRLTREVLEEWVVSLGITSVLDVGCGQGFAQVLFVEAGILDWVGVTRGGDVCFCPKPITEADMHFLPFVDSCFALVYARHIAEHSLAPLFFLRELARVASRYVLVIVPEVSVPSLRHQGHVSLLSDGGWRRLFDLAGLKLLKFKRAPYRNPPEFPAGAELRYLLATCGMVEERRPSSPCEAGLVK